MRRVAAGIAILLCLQAPATAAMDAIKNPADKIRNPADRMYNPATQVNNPAANIYNPATRIDNPNPLSPPTQPLPQATVKHGIPHKKYHFKTVKEYLTAAKKAFAQDDYIEFLSITEDALRRIEAGKLKASQKSKEKLAKFKAFGYELLEKSAEEKP